MPHLENLCEKELFNLLSERKTFKACKKIFEEALERLIHIDLDYQFRYDFDLYDRLSDYARTDALWYRSLYKMLLLAKTHQEYLVVYWATQPNWPSGRCAVRTGNSGRLLYVREQALNKARACVARRVKRAKSVKMFIRILGGCGHLDIALEEVVKPALTQIKSFEDMRAFVRYTMRWRPDIIKTNFGTLQRILSAQQIEWFRGILRSSNLRIRIVGDKIVYAPQ